MNKGQTKEKQRSNEMRLNKRQRHETKKLKNRSIKRPDLEILKDKRLPYRESPHSPPEEEDSEEAPTRMGNVLLNEASSEDVDVLNDRDYTRESKWMQNPQP